MRDGVLIGLGSGLVSALLVYSVNSGGLVLGQVLFLLIPLPSLVAGLGWGWLCAVSSGVAGTMLAAIFLGAPFAVGYALALASPVVLVAYLAYLSRPHPQDANAREWYPAGRLIAGMAIYAGALPVLLLPLMDHDGIRHFMSDVFRQLSKQLLPPDAQLSDQAIASRTELALSMLPAGVAMQWLLIFALNIYLAGRIALASGRLGRDWPDPATLTYPTGLLVLFPIAVLAAAAGGTIGAIGTSFTGALLAAYLLAGLALTHFVARGRAPWLVWLVYLGLLLPFLSPFFMTVVAFAGLLDSTFKLKQRLGSPPPST